MTAESAQAEPAQADAYVQAALEKQFKISSPEQLKAYQARLLAALAKLPPDGPAKARSLPFVEGSLQRAVLFLEAMDRFRPAAARHPELAPLVLPADYYQSAYEIAVEGIVAQIDQAARRLQRPPDVTRDIDAQVRRYRSDVLDVLQAELGGDGFALASPRATQILDEFIGVANHPFHGFERPLTPDEYTAVLQEVRGELRQRPFLKPEARPKEGSAPDELFGPGAKPAEKGGAAVVTDPAVAKATALDAVDVLYAYSRKAKPLAFRMQDQAKDLEGRAQRWLTDSYARNMHLSDAVAAREKARVARERTAASPPSPQPSVTPDRGPGPAPSVAVPMLPATPARDAPEGGGRSALATTLLLALVALVILAGYALRRRRAA